jgi:hypothetical protein
MRSRYRVTNSDEAQRPPRACAMRVSSCLFNGTAGTHNASHRVPIRVIACVSVILKKQQRHTASASPMSRVTLTQRTEKNARL